MVFLYLVKKESATVHIEFILVMYAWLQITTKLVVLLVNCSLR